MADTNPESWPDSVVNGETVSQNYDWSTTQPSTAVIETVSAATDTEPIELDTLQHAIDADALDTLVRDSDPDTFEISFEYAGVSALVTSGGTVRVRLD